MRELLGLDAVEALDAVWGVDEQTQQDLACIPAEKRGDVAEINVLYTQREMELTSRAMGIWDTNLERQLKQVRQERRAALEKLLTPRELFEFDLRFSETAQRLRDRSPGFDYTEAEFRAAFAAKDRFASQFGEDGRAYDSRNAAERAAQRAAQADVDAAMRQTLGDQRYALWRRSQDTDFVTLHSFAASWDLPETVAFQIYDLKEQGLEAATAVRNDTSLTNDEGRARRREIRAEIERTIKQLMGEKPGTRYLEEGGGYWVRNIASTPN